MISAPGYTTAANAEHGLFATIHSQTLLIYSSEVDLIAQIPLEKDFSSPKILKFCPAFSADHSSARVLVANDSCVHVYDARLPSYHAAILQAAAPTGRIAYTAFVSADEVLVVADFHLKTTIWNLNGGTGREIPNPKHLPRAGANYSVRAGTGHIALLTRSAASAKDLLVVLDATTDEAAAAVTLETQDAHGVQWSPVGQWLAIWENPALGTAVWIYTADGQLFRRWHEPDRKITRGIHCADWDTNGQWLLLGLGDNCIVGLRSRTFTPHFTLQHSTSITASDGTALWQEQISSSRPPRRDYAAALTPAIPPGPVPSSGPTATATPNGITHLAPCPTAPLLASVSAATPTTVWLHALPNIPSAAPSTHAVLIHHHPVRRLEWLATSPPRLLMHCPQPPPSLPPHQQPPLVPHSGSDSPSSLYWAHIYTPGQPAPLVLPVPAPEGVAALSGPPRAPRLEWLAAQPPRILLATGAGSVVMPVDGDGRPRITGEGPEDAFDEDDVAVAAAAATETGSAEAEARGEADVDDTFAFRRGWGCPVR